MDDRSRARFVRTVSRDEGGSRLDLLVTAWLGREVDRPLSKSVVRKLIMAGAIRLNGHPLRRPGAIVGAEARLEAVIDRVRLDRAIGSRAAVETTGLAILFEDDDLLAVAKPSGLAMHATADPRRPDLFTMVREQLALPYLGLHHRLDADTSGVVLFTRREHANAGLARQFAQGEVTKVYRAIVRRPRREVPRRWRVENRLAMAGGGRTACMQEAAAGARAATAFAILESLPAALLVEARPETGRKHQIRAHLAGSGLPILGDARYGGPLRAGRCVAPRVMLHAFTLSLRHPVTGAHLSITCPYPRDFTALLACLRRPAVY